MPLPAERCCCSHPALLAISLIALGLYGADGSVRHVDAELPSLRRPVSLAVAGPWLYVTNRDSGTISIVDLQRDKVVGEVKFGQQLAGSAYVDARHELLTVDSQRHALLVITARGPDLRLAQRIGVAHHPVDVSVSHDQCSCSVASLWSRQLTLLNRDSAGNGNWKISTTIDLPFAPRKQVFLPGDTHLVVADSFGGQLAVIDVASRSRSRLMTMDAHNIRGMSISHDKESLLVTHQLLNGYVPTTRERVFWGTLMGNVVRTIEIRELLNGTALSDLDSAREVAHWSLLPLGEPEDAAGDPESLAITPQGHMAIAIGGVDQLAIQPAPRQPVVRIKVGRRPTSVVMRSNTPMCYVANTFDDTISVVDLETRQVTATISLGARRVPSAIEHGEMLFYDSRLSLDGWFSCHSCHTDGHTNGRVNDNFADGSTGASKRVLTLLGVAQTEPWSWVGSKKSLHEQIHSSITTTMRGKAERAAPEDVADLVAYLGSLNPPPSLHQARRQIDPVAQARGQHVFHDYGCAKCHAPPRFTTKSTYDVGLKDESGQARFNPPSLRGVSQQAAFFHDGRARSLRDVFAQFGHYDSDGMSPQELDDLLVFLQSLRPTDSVDRMQGMTGTAVDNPATRSHHRGRGSHYRSSIGRNSR